MGNSKQNSQSQQEANLNANSKLQKLNKISNKKNIPETQSQRINYDNNNKPSNSKIINPKDIDGIRNKSFSESSKDENFFGNEEERIQVNKGATTTTGTATSFATAKCLGRSTA